MSKDRKVLLVTEKDDITADLIIAEVIKQNSRFCRLNCEDFASFFTASWSPLAEDRKIYFDKESFSIQEFKSIWYRRTPLFKTSNVSFKSGVKFINEEKTTFLEGMWQTNNCFWINRPSNVNIAKNKLVQLDMAKKIGMNIPNCIIANDPNVVKIFAKRKNMLIAKAISVGAIKDENVKWGIYAENVSDKSLIDNDSIKIAPFILQERIRRKAELRIIVVGTKVYATEIILKGCENKKSDWHLADYRRIVYKIHKIPSKFSDLCVRMTKLLGLVYAAFDFIITPDDKYIFLELNPSGQWGWIEYETGYPITKNIVKLLIQGRI